MLAPARILPAPIVIAAVLALAGCGSSTKTIVVQAPTQALTTSGAAATGTSATSATSATTAGSSSTATTPGAGSQAPSAIVHLSAFQSPTGNIGCMIVGALARCDIGKRTWSPPARPSSCPNIVDFGQGLEVGETGSGRFVCAGDTVKEPASPRLAYGTAAEMAGFQCISRTSGVTCTSISSGHGFTLAIQGYRLF